MMKWFAYLGSIKQSIIILSGVFSLVLLANMEKNHV
jgi:hypothetical protein